MSLLLLSLLACGPGLRPAWDMGPGDYSPVPAITSDGTLITASYAPYTAEGTLIALDPADGSQLWWIAHRNDVGPLPLTLDGDDNIVINGPEALYGIEAASGDEVWRVDVEGDGILPGVAVDADLGVVYAVRTGQQTPQVVAVAPPDLLWSVPLPGAQPILALGADGTLYVAGEDLLALDPDGGEIWRVALPGATWSMAVDRDQLVVVVPSAPHAPPVTAAYARADGALRWTSEHASYGEPIIASDGTIFIAGGSTLRALDGDTGALLWDSGNNHYDPALGADGRVYSLANLLEDPDMPELGSMLQFTVASASSGEILWQEHQHDAIEIGNGSPNFDGSRVYFAGGFFYAHLYAFDGGPGLGSGPWPRGGADPANRRQER